MTQQAVTLTDRLQSGWRLYPEQVLTSTHGKFHFKFYASGAVGLYAYTLDQQRWVDPNQPEAGPYAEMLSNGNFVAYRNNGTVRWETGTAGHPGAYLVVQDDGNVVVYGPANEVLWPGPGACSYTMTPTPLDFLHVAAVGGVDVAAPAGCPWSVSSSAAWATVSITTDTQNGAGHGTVTINVAANSGARRTATVTVEGQTFTITQGGVGSIGDRLLAGARMYAGERLTSGNGQFMLELPDNDFLRLSLVNPDTLRHGWGSPIGWSYAEMRTDGKFVVRGTAGNGGYDVSGPSGFEGTNPQIVLQDDGNLVIRQANGAYIWDAGLACTSTPTPQSALYTHDGGGRTVNVIAQDGCPWTATSSVSWITINSGQSGIGSGSFSFSVAPNSGMTRNGTLTIGGQTFFVEEGGLGNLGDHLSPGQRMYDGQWLTSSDGRYTLSLSSNSHLTLAGPGVNWSDGHTPGLGYIEMLATGDFKKYNLFNGVTLDYRAEQPTGSVAQGPATSNSYLVMQSEGNAVVYRSGGADWSWQSHTSVPQCTSFSVSPPSMDVGAYASSVEFIVTTQAGCSWEAHWTSGNAEITSGWSGSGSGSVTISVSTNGTTSSRTATFEIANHTVTINQTGAPTQNRLSPNDVLWPGNSRTSLNGQYTLTYQGDANLVVYGPGGPWHIAHLNPGYAGLAQMQGDGNFVVYDYTDGIYSYVYDTQTNEHDGAYLTIEDDGYLVVWAPDGSYALKVFRLPYLN